MQLSIITNQFTYEKPEIIYESEKKVQVSNFLDVELTRRHLSLNDIYYKPTHTNQHIRRLTMW